MELELGLKITRTRDDVTTFSDLRVAKDRSGAVFSRETDTMFILIIHLKGFKKQNIDIEINEDGSQISIKGQKPVQELSLVGWTMHKKDVELRTFKKVFRIPHGVILDRIKAKFDDDESLLTINMPKLAKGIRGLGFEEVKDGELDRGKAEADKGFGEQAEPKTKEAKETEEVARKEFDMRKPDATEEVADKFPSDRECKDIEKEDSTGTSIKSKEIDRVVKQEVGPEAMTEVSEPFPVSDKDKGVQEEKLEGKKTQYKEEKAKLLEANINEVSRKMKDEGEVMPERAPGSIISEKPAIEYSREFGKAGTAESPAMLATLPKPNIREDIEQSQKVEPRSAEENQFKKQQKLKKTESFQEEKPDKHIDELKSPEPVQEKEDLPKTHDNREQVENEIQEATAETANLPRERVDEKESMEGKQKDLTVSKRLCPPLFFAGSAVLLSFIVVVINIIRNKRK